MKKSKGNGKSKQKSQGKTVQPKTPPMPKGHGKDHGKAAVMRKA